MYKGDNLSLRLQLKMAKHCNVLDLQIRSSCLKVTYERKLQPLKYWTTINELITKTAGGNTPYKTHTKCPPPHFEISSWSPKWSRIPVAQVPFFRWHSTKKGTLQNTKSTFPSGNEDQFWTK